METPVDASAIRESQASAEELARMQRANDEALRMAQLQMERAKAARERRIAEIQTRLAKEEAARVEAEEKARETLAKLDELAQLLEKAKHNYAQLASERDENSEIQKSQMTAAIEAAQQETLVLKKRQEKLEQMRLLALAEQERMEAELRAEIEKYRRIEKWDYSYQVKPGQDRRSVHIPIKAKMKANPNQ